MKLWHDDIRVPPCGFDCWVRTNEAARAILDCSSKDRDRHPYGIVTEISMDHDLGMHTFDPTEQDADLRRGVDSEETGLTLVRWMIEPVLELATDRPVEEVAKSAWRRIPDVINIHSWNPYGAKVMRLELERVGRSAHIVPYERTADDYEVSR